MTTSAQARPARPDIGSWNGSETFHGPHPEPPVAGTEKITWYPVWPPLDKARIRESTCGCSTLVYELCSNGSYWIRRTTRINGRLAVAETPHEDAAEVRELWNRLFTGRAH